MPNSEFQILVAKIVSAHGLNGMLRLKTYTSSPKSLLSFPFLQDCNKKKFKLLSFKSSQHSVIATFEGISTRTEAETFIQTKLFVPRSQLPDNLLPNEFYAADLVGSSVYTLEKKLLGTVHGIFDFGAGSILEVRLNSGKKVLIPFKDSNIISIELTAQVIVIDPIASGLNDDK